MFGNNPTMRNLSNIPATLLWSLLLSCFVFAALSVISFKNTDILSDSLYAYDEADYMYAAEKGFLANHADRGTLPFDVFYAHGMKTGFEKSKWGQLSKFIRSSDDIAFYRHFHGPLYFYWLQAAKSLGLSSEKQMRFATLVLLLFSLLLFCVLLYMLFPNQPFIMFPPFIMLFVLGPSMILTFNHITPHGLYVVLSLASLGGCALYCKYGLRRYWYVSVMAASLAFLTIEYSAILILTMLITLWLFRKTHFTALSGPQRLRFVTGSILCFTLPIVILWPGGLFKLTIVKNYLFYTYFTLIRGDLYSSFSALQVWGMRVIESPFEYLVLLYGLAALPFLIKKNRWLIPLGLYVLFILLTSMRNQSTFPQYLASIFPVLYLIAATGLLVTLKNRPMFLKTATLLFITAGILANSCTFFMFHTSRSWQNMPHEITSLDDLKTILAKNDAPLFVPRDYIPVIHYYFPTTKLNPFNPVFENHRTVVGKAFSLLGNQSGHILLIFDHDAAELPEMIEPRCLIESRQELFLSNHTPNAICYRLSCR
jgi:hypothetical protein